MEQDAALMDHRSDPGISLCLFLWNLGNIFHLCGVCFFLFSFFFFLDSLHRKNSMKNGRTVVSPIASFTESDIQ